MLKSIRTITIMGCLIFPLASFGASEQDAKFDQKLAEKIQRKIAKDDSLKSDAGTVNVSVENGVVTLKGTASSDERRADIQGKAESQAIQASPTDRIHSVIVHNELTVAPK
jgi:hypothetical protein